MDLNKTQAMELFRLVLEHADGEPFLIGLGLLEGSRNTLGTLTHSLSPYQVASLFYAASRALHGQHLLAQDLVMCEGCYITYHADLAHEAGWVHTEDGCDLCPHCIEGADDGVVRMSLYDTIAAIQLKVPEELRGTIDSLLELQLKSSACLPEDMGELWDETLVVISDVLGDSPQSKWGCEVEDIFCTNEPKKNKP